MKMRKPVAFSAFLILVSSVCAQETVDEWDAARDNIMNESILEIREYEAYRYMPSSYVRLLAACMVEKRIQMAKKFGCRYVMAPGATMEEHLAKQRACFEKGGYTQAARTEHGEFCRIMAEEYFRALDGNK
jgi:hypothetical protein